MVTDIFPRRSQTAENILGGADLRKVLIIPVDFAKETHVAQLVRGTGEYLRKRPVNVHNSMKGSRYLVETVERCCAKYRIPKSRVLFGGEDPPEYVRNFVDSVRAEGYAFVRVNAKEAKKYRSNTRATSDALALDGISQAILLHRAYELIRWDELYGAMKLAERSRRRLKREETALKNRMRRFVDVLFPGLLKESVSGLSPFGLSCLDLMESGCSVMRIRRMHTNTLAKRLKAGRTHNPGEVAAQLKELAKEALPPDPASVPYLETSIAAKTRHLKALRQSLRVEENEMARCLVQTPGFLITSIPGIGVVLAGGLVAEFGDPRNWPDSDRMASYAGIVCRQYQTGGPDSNPVKGRLPIDSNHHLKDQLLQAAYHTGHNTHPAWRKLDLPGEHPLFEHYRSVELRGGKSRLSTAKKLIRVVLAMMRNQAIYMPPDTWKADAPGAMSTENYFAYLNIVGEMLKRKWNGYDLSGIPKENNMLARWLEDIADLIEFSKRYKKS